MSKMRKGRMAPYPDLEAEIADRIHSRLENGIDFDIDDEGGYIFAGPIKGSRFQTNIVDDSGHFFEIVVIRKKALPEEQQ